MTEPKSSLEIMDVLSSIRRLVSEDRKGAANMRIHPIPPAVQGMEPDVDSSMGSSSSDTAPVLPSFRSEPVVFRPSGLPTESRFVLTAAHRVPEDAPAVVSLEGKDDVSEGPSAASADTGQILASSLQFDHSVVVGELEAAHLSGLPDLNTLEGTIAELEAAVAGIEAEFEPDGGDADSLPADDMPSFDLSPWRSASAATRPMVEYQGLTPPFERAADIEEPLDTPITGDLPVVDPEPQTGPTFWRNPAPVVPLAVSALSPAPAAVLALADENRLTDGVALPLAPEAKQGTKAGSASSDGVPTSEMAEPGDLAACSPAEPGVELFAAPKDPEMSSDVTSMRLHLSERPQGRPVIVRSAPNGDDEDNLAVLDEMATTEEDEADEDLFDPLAASNIDLEALRDLVAEIVRDELRGTLGERITRNLRVLVRKEIGRALSNLPVKPTD